MPFQSRQSCDLVLALMLASLLSVGVPGDVIHLKDGGKIEGRIVSQNPSVLTIDPGGVSMEVSSDRVERIEEEDDAWDFYRLGHNAQRAGRLEAAARYLKKALALAPEHAAAKQLQRQTMEAIRSTVPLPTAWRRIRETVEAGDVRAAERLAAQQLERPMRDDAEAGAAAAVLIELGLALVDRIEYHNAETYLARALELQPGNREAGEAIAGLWERQREKWPMLVSYYEKTAAEEPENAPFKRRLAEALIRSGRHDEALAPLRDLLDSEGTGSKWLRERYIESVRGALRMEKPRTPEERAALFELGAFAGDSSMMYALGEASMLGFGRRKDLAEAAFWFVRGAKSGHSQCLYECAKRLEFGIGIEQNIEEAIVHLGASASLGNAQAREDLYTHVEAGNPSALFYHAVLDIHSGGDAQELAMSNLRKSSELGFELADGKLKQIEDLRKRYEAAVERREARRRAAEAAAEAQWLLWGLVFEAAVNSFNSTFDSGYEQREREFWFNERLAGPG